MSARSGIRGYIADVWEAWNEFWFTPTNPATLSAIRVLRRRDAVLHPPRVVVRPARLLRPERLAAAAADARRPSIHANGGPDSPTRWIWTYFDYIHSPTVLWIVHIAALFVFFFLMIGFFSRTMAVLAYVIAVSYANRVTPGRVLRPRQDQLHAGHVPDARAVRRPLFARPHLAAAPRCAARGAAERRRPTSPSG